MFVLTWCTMGWRGELFTRSRECYLGFISQLRKQPRKSTHRGAHKPFLKVYYDIYFLSRLNEQINDRENTILIHGLCVPFTLFMFWCQRQNPLCNTYEKQAHMKRDIQLIRYNLIHGDILHRSRANSNFFIVASLETDQAYHRRYDPNSPLSNYNKTKYA